MVSLGLTTMPKRAANKVLQDGRSRREQAEHESSSLRQKLDRHKGENPPVSWPSTQGWDWHCPCGSRAWAGRVACTKCHGRIYPHRFRPWGYPELAFGTLGAGTTKPSSRPRAASTGFYACYGRPRPRANATTSLLVAANGHPSNRGQWTSRCRASKSSRRLDGQGGRRRLENAWEGMFKPEKAGK